MPFVAGPGHVLIVDPAGSAGAQIASALGDAGIEARQVQAENFPQSITKLIGTDAVVLVNTDNSLFTYQQQEMLRKYVQDLGGGLVMIGGPDSFGAGGWIGSPLAKILPVDLDPPQKKQMPKGALVLIMHACEMPRGNYWGKKVALSAVRVLSRLDLVGILSYSWQPDNSSWVYPLSKVGDRKSVTEAIRKMEMGDMPDFAPHMQEAYDKLKDSPAAVKHIIIISDGDPAPPSIELLRKLRQANITCSGVAVFPHDPTMVQSLLHIAKETGGKFYHVKNPSELPQIFTKEARVIRRPLIMEETFTPQVTFGFSEILKGIPAGLPKLDGYVLTGRKGGVTQVVLSNSTGDPVLATGQAGLGRCVAFTSTADSRWASKWLEWGSFDRFWEQTIRWASKSSHPGDCEIFADVHGRNVTVSVEAVDAEGDFVQLGDMSAQIIGPDLSVSQLGLSQVGPGTYRATFKAPKSGSYLVNLRYKKAGVQTYRIIQSAITVPHGAEYRDLSDNSALLAEVARLTGGRVLSPNPAEANLFRRDGLKFPQTTQPLTRPLIFIWLVIFLLDVAVRRLAMDLVAARRGVSAMLARLRPRRSASATLERLKDRRSEVRQRMTSETQSKFANQRFEADEDILNDSPAINIIKPAPKAPAKKQTATEEEKPKPQQGASHLQQLLKAKRNSSQRTNTNPDQSGDN